MGAHIGQYTVFLSKRVGADGRVFAIEPNPPSYRLLCKNVGINNCRNVTPYNLGMSDADSMATIVSKRFNTATATFKKDKQLRHASSGQPVASHEIALTTVDRFVQEGQLNKLDFIKIDTEGFEPRVITGMKECLVRYAPAVFFELHGLDATQKLADFEIISDVFHAHGYILHYLRKGLPPATKERVRQSNGGAFVACSTTSPFAEPVRHLYS